MSILLKSLFIALSLWAQSPAETPPFWKAKANVYKRITNDREIIVSAHTNSIEIESKAKKELLLISAGHIHTPLAFTWKKILDFSAYPQISDHFRKVSYDATKKELYIKMGALGYYTDLWIRIQTTEEDKKRIMNWECFQGDFKGMKGVILLEDYKSKHTEISMNSRFVTEKIPIPSVIMSFGLEIIGKQMATKMRNYIEHAYKVDDSL